MAPVVRGLLAGVGLVLAAVAAAAAEPTGLWWAEGGAGQVEITPCGESLCGRVAWLRSPFDLDGCPLRDVHNPDPVLRQRELLGTRVLEGLRIEPDEPATWSGGRIYDPGSGRTYDVTMTLVDEDRLSVRGYVRFRFIGRTTTWIRVGSEGRCRERRARRVAQR
jgi:uncharacterized protein (DUF2147 family)